jgi:hypothetical protein
VKIDLLVSLFNVACLISRDRAAVSPEQLLPGQEFHDDLLNFDGSSSESETNFAYRTLAS